jgi:hypothetical protein
MKITQHDYNAFAAGKITLQDLCFQYLLREHTVRRALAKYRGPRCPLTKEDIETLRSELIAAVPYDKRCSTSAILKRWGIGSITLALNRLKVSSMAELRLGSTGPRVKALLKKYKLRLIKDVLFAHKDRPMYVDLDALTRDPEEWFKNNLELIRETCYIQRAKDSDTKKLSKHLLSRFKTATKTQQLLETKHTVIEIRKHTGTDMYIKALRTGTLDDLFTDEEKDLLQKAGLI